MKINIGDYLIETDERQFIVKAKKRVEESRFTKEENIGKEIYKPIAYCTSFNSALKFVPQDILKCNDEISVIKEKLEQIEADIKGIKEFMKLDVVTISTNEYDDLKNDSYELSYLKAAGVDNWEGYDYAMEMMEDEDNE